MLQLLNIAYSYDQKMLLENLNFNLTSQEVVCLLGESGSGKSTLLRIVAGLEKPLQGEVLWNGRNLANVPPNERNFGLMFQDYSLFPHLNVYDNIAFGLKMKKVAKSEIDTAVTQALEQIGMKAFAFRKVTELSGGEQQRVALARALAPKPHLLMLDEPLGALDHSLRVELLQELKEVLGKNGTPAIYVTHDHNEALTIGDRIAILHNGQILQNDSPEKIYNQPNSVWIARFMGMNNILSGKAVSETEVKLELASEEKTIVFEPKYPLTPGQTVHVLFRNGTIGELCEGDVCLPARVDASFFKGNSYDIRLKVNPTSMFTLQHPNQLTVGEIKTLCYQKTDLVLLFL